MLCTDILVKSLSSGRNAFVTWCRFLVSVALVKLDFLGNKNVVCKCPLSMYKLDSVYLNVA